LRGKSESLGVRAAVSQWASSLPPAARLQPASEQGLACN
jgi:hypothetical protein